MLIKYILIGFLLFIPSETFAETIKLISGQVIEGVITERTEDFVKVDSGTGISVTYFLDEVDSISESKLNELPQKQDIYSENQELDEVMNKAGVFASKRDIENALVYYNKALNIAPEDPRVNGLLGIFLFYVVEDYEKAAQYLSKSVSIFPGNDKVLYSLGMCELKLEEPLKAISHFTMASKINPDEKDYLRGLATAYFSTGGKFNKLGQQTKVREYIELAIEVNESIGENSDNLKSMLERIRGATDKKETNADLPNKIKNISYETYLNKDFGFTLDIPNSWTILKSGMHNVAVIIASPPDDKYDDWNEICNVIIDDLDEGIGLEEYVDENLEKIKSSRDFELIEQKTDNDLSKLIYTMRGEIDIRKTKVLLGLKIIGNKGYALTCSSIPGKYAQYEVVFERVANSLTAN